MATTSGTQEPQETECSVCQGNFVVPKILQCGHIFCRDCIVSVINSKTQPGCPLCRNAIVDPTKQEAGIIPESYADSLPTDFAMDALAASVEALAQEPVCCVCDDVRADSICLQCRDMLCPACTKGHKKLSATRGHDVESLSTVTAKQLATSRPTPCADHVDQQAGLFCTHHGVAICATCAIAKHRACPDVKDLASEVQSAEEVINGLVDTLIAAETKMEQSIDHLNLFLKESDSCQQLCDSLLVICSKQKELLTSLDSKGVLKSVCDTKQKVRERLARLKSHKRVVSRTKAACPRSALIFAKKSLQDRIKTLDLSVTLPTVTTISLNTFIKRIRTELRRREQQKKLSDENKPTFHKNRGSNVLLRLNDTCVDCQDSSGGVVVSSCALESQVYYTVVISEMRRDWQPNDIMFCGVTGTHPNDLTIKSCIWDMEDVLTVCPQTDNGPSENVRKLKSYSS
ncbi:E3 ubiquitin-protein ligase TRIM56-like [Pomacea canaliculata]|uniref:E3 ubiquitin-protein ligase TRIM56-like n=1 Tax=Pomacea canaliculata TaxID=400727 RepID=UPI000D72F94C|nr:E3 ubiquitin-protein ligase TRIM56-like [Pomacea canaliculata]XP_025114191.1 E3 ubiquitin-protein ligase TRIM56-like [Pomacea canaliculata]